MPVHSKLSPAVKTVIRREAERIEALGDEWRPTYENLCEVVEKARATEADVLKARRAEGMQRARDAGVPIGRKALPIPDNFEEVYDRWFVGELNAKEAGTLLGVSPTTFESWGKALRIRRGEPESARAAGRKPKAPSKLTSPRTPRSKKDRSPDEWRMLVLIRDAKKNPDGLSWLTLKEIGCILGWGKPKAKAVRDGLIESGRLVKEKCRAKTSNHTQYGYRITEAGWRFLEERSEGSQFEHEKPILGADCASQVIHAPTEGMAHKPAKSIKKPRTKKDKAVADQRLLLALLRANEPSSKEPAMLTLEEICDALGWSTLKLLEVRSDLLEAERLAIVECRSRDMRMTYGYRITEIGRLFLGK